VERAFIDDGRYPALIQAIAKSSPFLR